MPLTPHHDKCLQEAVNVLSKAYDGFLIVCIGTTEDQNGEVVRSRYGGGLVQAKGMATEFLQSTQAEMVLHAQRDEGLT